MSCFGCSIFMVELKGLDVGSKLYFSMVWDVGHCVGYFIFSFSFSFVLVK